jgi:hypothetical protein
VVQLGGGQVEQLRASRTKATVQAIFQQEDGLKKMLLH